MKKMIHISRHYLGLSTVLSPRIPVSQGQDEIMMKARVCASSSIEGAWLSISGSRLHDEIAKKHYGVYFFVYELTGSFERSTAKDAISCDEFCAYESVKAELISAFYIDRKYVNAKHLGVSRIENATIEEACNAYYEYQRDLLSVVEEIAARENHIK